MGRPRAFSRQLSALSIKNALVKRLMSNELKNFFAFCIEVTDKESICCKIFVLFIEASGIPGWVLDAPVILHLSGKTKLL